MNLDSDLDYFLLAIQYISVHYYKFHYFKLLLYITHDEAQMKPRLR